MPLVKFYFVLEQLRLIHLVFFFTNRVSAFSAYDNSGNPYNVTRVVNPDMTFNHEAYKQYSPLYLP